MFVLRVHSRFVESGCQRELSDRIPGTAQPGGARFGGEGRASVGPTSPGPFQAHGDDLFAGTFHNPTADLRWSRVFRQQKGVWPAHRLGIGARDVPG
jgi:hypothetical protein